MAGDTRKTPFDVDRGDFDLVVVKYDSSGDEIWSSQFGTPGHDHATSVTLALDGSIYVGGHTTGEFPGQTRSAVDPTHTDLILIKVDSTGEHQWTRQYGTATSTRANDVTTDQAGNAYVTGYTMGQLPGNNYRGELDAFVAKYDSSGKHLWTRQFGTAGNDIGNALATDSSGNVFVTGYVSGALPGQAQSGDSDAFAIKFSSDGTMKWTTQFGMPGGESAFGFFAGNAGHGITVAENGDVLVAGNTTGSFPKHSNQGGRDLFMTRLTSSGGIRSTFQYGNAGSIDVAAHAISDESGNYYIGGKITLVEESGTMIVDNVIIIKYRP